MFHRLLTILAVAFALATAQPARAQPAPSDAAVAAATELLVALGTEKQFTAVLPLMMQQIRTVMVQTNPSVTKEVDEILPQLIKKFEARSADVVPLVAQIYARRLTIDDMKAMTAFFKSPPGQRFVETMPQVTQESMQIGQEWGRRLGQEVDRDIREELAKRGIRL